MADTQLEAAHRELDGLYKRLAMVRPLSWERMNIQMRISRLRRQIKQLEGTSSETESGAG